MLLRVKGGAAASIESSPGRVLAYPEVLRCVLCVLVVLGHCDNAFMGFAIAGVVGFLSMSIGFAFLEQDKPRHVRRAGTTIRLWLVWSAIYAALLMMKDILTGEPLGSFYEPWMLAMGPSMHLWFLPALALSLLFLALAARHRGERWIVIACAVAAIGSWITREIVPDSPLPAPFGHAMLTTFIVALASVSSQLMPGRLPHAWAPAVWMSIALAITCTQLDISEFASYALLVPATIALCRLRQPSPPTWLISCSGLTAGVYLVHPASLAALKPLALDTWLAVPGALATSAILTWAGRRGPLRSMLP